jgi:hypothetical protein
MKTTIKKAVQQLRSLLFALYGGETNFVINGFLRIFLSDKF